MENDNEFLKICVVVCTHNPIIEKLSRVIKCIDENRKTSDFRLVIIDNASNNSGEIQNLCNGSTEYFYEGQKGNSHARYRALKMLRRDELLIFVDDDNYIAPNFVEQVTRISAMHPECGCFGGRSYPSPYLKRARWKIDLLPYLGIIDRGSEVKLGDATLNWNNLEPIGAGMCVRPEVVKVCLDSIEKQDSYFELGRAGTSLLSGEDSFIARQTTKLNLQYGYFPDLKLIHDIKPERLRLVYLAKLLYGYGKSDVILNETLEAKPAYPYPKNTFECLMRYFYISKKGFAGLIIGFRQFGQFFASKKS